MVLSTSRGATPREAGRYTGGEWEIIRHGLVPRIMEDRWFWYVDDDNVLHAHRSSSGIEIFAAQVASSGGSWVTEHLYATADWDHFRWMLPKDAVDELAAAAQLFADLVDGELLRL